MKNPVKIKGFFVSGMVHMHDGSGLLKLILIFILLNGPVVFAQVGVHTDFPDASSAMDISASNKGLLIPRVTLSENLDNPSPVSSPAVGLLVFNSGNNQEKGFYYWDGSFWVQLGAGGAPSYDWSLTGNSGTEVGTNFIGTTDAEDFAVYTNAAERMRVMANGQVVIDSTAARYANNLFTVFGNTTQDYAINAYSSNVGIYTSAGVYGLVPRVNSSTGWPIYAKNTNTAGYGAVIVGSNQSAGTWSGRSAGLCSRGNDGIHTYGLGSGGIGIMAMGSGLSPAIIADAGGTFVGVWGLYGRSTVSGATGTGIIGVGNNYTSSYYLAGGSGGAFSGNDGIFGKSILPAGTGTGVIGLGNNISGAPTVIAGGSGGAFTGTTTGAGGWGASYGLIGWGQNATAGTGVVGAGNNLASAALGGGSGGAFIGQGTGSVSWATSATGTGVIGAGNNAAALPLSTGSGGAFNGNDGIYSKGTLSTGTGVIAAGNNISPVFLATGSGGAFIGNDGVYGKGGIASGTGIIGVGSNAASYTVIGNGSGGAFTGYHGSISVANNVGAGTGVIGAGNNVAYSTLATGGGGAFIGTNNGAYAKATSATGTGIIGVGNNVAAGTLYFSNGSGGAFTGTVCGVAGYATTAGGTSYGVYGSYTGGGAFDGVGVYGYSYPNNNYGIGVYGLGRKYGVFASGGFGGTGAKYFVIDHPLDPENRILRHAAIESPEVLNMYRGNIVLNSDGEATIQLPDYFMSININFSYDLTAVGKPAPDLYIRNEIDDSGKFTIAGGSPNQKISWVVYAERNDLFMRQDGIRAVEIEKDEWEKGKYLMPGLYNQPPEKGIYYIEAHGEIQTTKDQERIIRTDHTVPELTENKITNKGEQVPAEVKQLDEMQSGELKIVEEELPPNGK